MAVKGKGKQIASSSSEPSVKRKRPAASSSAAASASASAPRRKKRRSGVLQFVDDAAVDAESEDSDDGFSDLEKEEIDLDLTDHSQKAKDAKGAGKPNTLPFFIKEEDLSGDELEELIRDRYGPGSEHVVYDEDIKPLDDVQAIKELPIWRVKCRAGWERKIAFSLMQKYTDLHEFGTKMKIISIFSVDHVQGYVYIEAEKSNDVIEACKGLCSVYLSRLGFVPRNEVPHLLSTRNKSCEVTEGAWVRLKNGSYKGDVAQVVAVDNKQRRATVKLVPRIDLQALAKKFGGGVSLKHAAVPTPRLISSRELEDFRPHIQTRRDCQTGEFFDVLDGLMLKDGYLYKKVSFGALVLWGVQPSDAEREKFLDLSKDAAEDVNWMSSVYEGRKNMRSGEVSDHKLDAEKRNGIQLLDLVLFGRKSFGVIVAVDSDSYQVLKGDAEGSEVVTVKVQEVKNVCVDKMFKATDHQSKIISINDVVKVLEGPLQGRQGIVRHMYRGTLFIYDETQAENCGIFCVSAKLCENMTDSKNSYGGKSNKKSSSSFSKSPTRSFQQDDESGGFNRQHQSNTNSIFSIGQTLRIRKGPLKGYLCRVMRIYRSDITVKLDSLVKVITVEEQFLSVPNFKRDEYAAVTSDGGIQIGQCSELGGDGVGAPPDSSWDTGRLPNSRDSWQGLSSFSLLSAGNNDNRNEDQEKGDDPWSSKVSVGHDQALDSWDKATSLSGEHNQAWNKSKVDVKTIDDADGQAGNQERDADVWSRNSTLSASTEGWEKAKFPSIDGGGSWGNESSKGGKEVDPSNNASGHWERPKANLVSVDGWDKAVKGKGVSLEQGSSWMHPENISQSEADAWDIKGKSTMRNDDNSWGNSLESQEKNADEKKDWGNRGSSWDAVKVPSGSHPGNWNNSKDTCLSDKEGWGNKVGHSSNDNVEEWNKPKSFAGDQVSNWDKPKTPSGGKFESWEKPRDKPGDGEGGWKKAVSTVGEKDGWQKPKAVGADPESNWSEGKHTSDRPSDSWNKENDGHKDERGGWNKGSYSNQAERDGWCKSKIPGGDQASSWDKADLPSGGDNWSRSKAGSDVEAGGWNNASCSSQRQTDMWDKPKSFQKSQVPTWSGGDDDEASRNSQRPNWDKSTNFDGGRGSGRGRGGGRGSGWGRERNGTGGNGDDENGWQRNADRGGGFSGGRGRGRYGAGRNGDQDGSWKRPGDTDGGWRPGRGRGRGRNESWESHNNFEDTKSFGRSRGVDGWDANQSGGWGRQKSCGADGGFQGENERQGGWSSGKPSDGNWSSGWKNNPQDTTSRWNKEPGGSKESWGITEKSDWNKGGRGTFSSNPSTCWGTDQSGKHYDGSPGEANKPGSPKAYGEKQSSSWNQEALMRDAGDDGGWNRAIPSSSRQPSGWNNDKRENWNAAKASSGSWSSGQENKPAGKEAGGQAVVVGGSWGNAEPSSEKRSSGWMDNRTTGTKEASLEEASGGWVSAKPSVSPPLSGWNSSLARNNSSGEASGVEDKWNGPTTVDEKRSSTWSSDSNLPDKAASQGVANPSGIDRPSSWVNDGRKDWNNDEGGWNKPKLYSGDSSSTWKDGSTDRSDVWNSGRSFGGGQSSAGRGNTFSNRGRGRGRNFGGHGGGRFDRQESGGEDAGETFNQRKSFGRGQSSGWNQEGFTRGGNRDRGSYGGWEGEKDRGLLSGGDNHGGSGGWGTGGTDEKVSWSDWAKPDSGEQKASGEGEGGKDVAANKWDRPKGSHGGGGLGWSAGSSSAARQSTGGQPEGWNQNKGSDGASGSGGWMAGAGSGPSADTWNRGESGSGEQKSDWNQGSNSAAKESTGGQPEGWNQKKGSDGAASGSGGWMAGAGSGRTEDAWNRRESGSGEQKSGWNQGDVVKEGGAGSSEKASSTWGKEAGGWAKAKDEGGRKGGW